VRAELQAELVKQRARSEHGVQQAVQAEPDLVAAARVGQVVDSLDATRLTPDADLAGRDAHLSAVEMAHDQMARGENVDVEYIVAPTMEPPPIQVSEHNGWLSATVDGGLVGGHIRDGALHISSSELAPDLRGAGIGTAMYRALVDEAHARGLRVFSDSTVSADAVRVYDSLRRRGYDVQRTPGGGELMSPSGASEGAFGAGAVSPAFEVRAKQRGPEHTAAAVDELRAVRTPPEPKAPREPVAPKEPKAGAGKAAKQEPLTQPSSGPQAARSGEGEGVHPPAWPAPLPRPRR
jgi:ribosomal protein S18 acetylase RimI-like enzyme